jgi:hypothetical protein
MIVLSSATTWRSVTRLVLLVILGLSACAGIVYWALLGSLLGVVVSALAPGRLAMWIVTAGSAKG